MKVQGQLKCYWQKPSSSYEGMKVTKSENVCSRWMFHINTKTWFLFYAWVLLVHTIHIIAARTQNHLATWHIRKVLVCFLLGMEKEGESGWNECKGQETWVYIGKQRTSMHKSFKPTFSKYMLCTQFSWLVAECCSVQKILLFHFICNSSFDTLLNTFLIRFIGKRLF